MQIRLMGPDDYDQAHRMWCETPGMGIRSLNDSREGIERFLRRNPSTCFVAEEDGRLAGVILCGHDGRRGYIYHTAVHPGCRRKGVGKALVSAALEGLKQEHIHKAALVAFSSNGMGNAFWAALGFERRDDLVYRNISLNEKNR